jgi:ATP-dependent Clp protease ATP-binding subunit ClpA
MKTLVDVHPVLREACAEAMRTGHPHVGSEHLALIALSGPDGLLAMAAEAGVDALNVKQCLLDCCHDAVGSTDRATEPRITPRTSRMVAGAAQMALLDGSEQIGPIHLAATLLLEPGAIAWTGLVAAGITPAMVYAGLERRQPPWLADRSKSEGRSH